MEEEEEDFDPFSSVLAHGVGSAYDFYFGPPPRSKLCKIQVPVFCGVNKWHLIYSQDFTLESASTRNLRNDCVGII